MSRPPKNPNAEKIPKDASEWFRMIQAEPEISHAVKQGKTLLHVAHTDYHSGSNIRPSEFLHLRAFWQPHAEGPDTLDHYIRDKDMDGFSKADSFKGYVSEENNALAGNICSNLSSYWHNYLAQLKADASGFTSDRRASVWAMVHLWQELVSTHTKKPGSDVTQEGSEDDGDSKRIVKKGYTYDPNGTRDATRRFENLQLRTPQRNSRPTEAVHGTPAAVHYSMGTAVPANAASVDEMYSNMALLLFLQAATSEAIQYLGNMNWVPPRLALKLKTAAATGGGNLQTVELMQALVDGYLCNRTGGVFDAAPLAICEAKPFVRTVHAARTQRQETAEMASWIAHHSDSRNGVLQQSNTGRKRRLLVSQDRHEIYIIIGEYGHKYEQYITGQIELKATTDKPKNPETFDPAANRDAAAGSRASVKVGKWVNDAYFVGSQQQPPPQQQQQQQKQPQRPSSSISGMWTRSRTASASASASAPKPAAAPFAPLKPKEDQELPHADEFLIMHQFGPYLIHESEHMERFLRRIIAFMLQLRCDLRYRIPPPNVEFSGQKTARSFPPRREMKRDPSELYRG